MGMERWLRLGAGLLIAFAMVACSDDSSDGDSSSGTGGDTVTGGTGGVGGTGGTSTGTGGTGGSSGTGGTMTTAGTMSMVMCDTSIATTATCGGTACPAPSAFANPCTVPCCDGDSCGFRSAAMDMTTECKAAPIPDPDCPDYVGVVTLPGCCFDGVQCGFISGMMNACVITHPSLTDLADMAGASCDGSDQDAGTEPADGGP